MITQFVLNAILHHVGMSWIISSNKEMKYEMDESNHQDRLNKSLWYSIYICLKLHGGIFEDFITHARTDRYNLMCSLVEYIASLKIVHRPLKDDRGFKYTPSTFVKPILSWPPYATQQRQRSVAAIQRKSCV